MPKVIIWRDGAIESEFDPRHRDWRIGRSETNDITLLDPRKSVSRFHAELREEDGRWVFIDLNSQNGSWLNGERINRFTLDHGSEVLFGDYKLVFEDERLKPVPPVEPAGAGLATASFDEEQDRTMIAPGRAVEAPASTVGSLPPPAHTPPPPPSRPVTPPPPRTATSPPRPPVPPPAVPAAKGAATPPVARKGVNPVLIVVPVLLILLGGLAFVGWRVVQGRRVAVQIAEVQPTTVPEPPVTPPPATPPAPTPSEVPGATTEPPSTTPPTTPESPAPASPGPGDATPGTTTPATPAPGPATPAAPTATRPSTPRPKRAPAAPKEAPALVARYDEGRRALDAGRFGEAQRAFEAVIAQQPAFRDAAALLQKARAGQQAAARERLLADAQNFEASGEWSRAVSAYEKAGATEQAASARQKMHAAGEDAYRKARQFDARNVRSEAETWYQRAVEWLPTSDPRRATAQQRLAAVKGGGE